MKDSFFFYAKNTITVDVVKEDTQFYNINVKNYSFFHCLKNLTNEILFIYIRLYARSQNDDTAIDLR